MSDERRAARRIRLPGVQVTYEDAAGERFQARVVDLSREGLYIPTDKPIPVGKRLSLEIQPVGDLATWSALGRVVWVRETTEAADRPAGMAVKIIDAEDAVLSAIQGLLEAREPTERGLGTGDAILPVRPKQRSNPPPQRERTILGVQAPAAAPAAPILLTAPGREPTLLGVGLAHAGAQAREAMAKEAEGREVSLAIDLVTKKPPSARPPDGAFETAVSPVRAPASAPPAPVPVPLNPVEVPTPIVAVVPADLAASSALDEEARARAPSARPPASERPALARPDVDADDDEPIRLPKRSTGKWLLLLLILGGLGGAAYVFRDRLPGYWAIALGTIRRVLH
ncbi:MAG TPA: PilZ domain-containing protein [Polyangiaceae bacterium]|jgi:uncharacterized protein (TIGR02266 family)|nr:PilZ domain-containing protein [Polyangiaceae bacterium]